MFERLGGRQENVEQTVADLGDQRGRRRRLGFVQFRVLGIGRGRQRVGHGSRVDHE